MMTYELAKQLKDAGFPQGGNGTYSEGEESFGLGEPYKSQNVYYPTLSELIEACSDMEFELQNGEEATGDWGTWYAAGFKADDSCSVEGNTPEEAVAKLWLAMKVFRENGQ